MTARATTRTIAILLAVLCLTGGAWALGARTGGGAQTPPIEPLAPEEVKRFTDAWAQQPTVDLGIPKDGAKVIVVKFNDWLCPACKGMHEVYQPIFDKFEKEMPGAVKYIVKDWPWNSRCNFTVPQTFAGHESSCEAAMAVRMARDRGKDKEREMVTWLFSEQSRLIDLRVKPDGAAAEIRAKAAALLGLKPADFAQQSALRLSAVRQDVADGVALHVEVTPTYYVNGIKTTAPVNPNGTGGNNLPGNYFELALRLELKKAGGK